MTRFSLIRFKMTVMWPVLALISFSLNISAAPPIYKFLTLEHPPYSYIKDGEIKGIAVDLVKEAAQRAGFKIELELIPWKRSLLLLEAGHVDGLFTAIKTPERELFADYSDEIILETVSLFVQKKSSINFHGDSSKLYNYSIAVIRGFSYGALVDNAIERGLFKNITLVNNASQGFKMLMANRVEAVFCDRLVASYLLDTMDTQSQIKEILPSIQDTPVHLIFSKKLNLNMQKALFNKALDSMRIDGTYAKVLSQ